MGNCMERSSEQAREMHEDDKQEDGGREKVVKERSAEKGGVRVKIVVTKEELEWLMVEINTKGGKSLEKILAQIQRGRDDQSKFDKTHEAWKPSLDSIMECPELTQEIHT